MPLASLSPGRQGVKMALPALKRTPRQSPTKRTPKKVTLKSASTNELCSPIGSERSTYTFDNNSLVDSPRMILLEKTTLGMQTTLTSYLETFYLKKADISEEDVENAKQEVFELIDYIFPRMKKLGRKDGFKIKKAIYIGSLFDDTCVLDPTNIDVLIEIEKDKTTVQSKGHGYKYIPLRKYKQVEGGKPDTFRFGRSTDGRYLSPSVISKGMQELVDRSLKLHPDAVLVKQKEENDSNDITVVLDRYRIHIIPSFYVETDNSYLVTKPYDYDENPSSDCLWRVYNTNKENAILRAMDAADRGMRRKAFKLLKTLVLLEPTLSGIPSYHLKTVLLQMFEDTVDTLPRWQRTSVETCFLGLLQDLAHSYGEKCLGNYFLANCNLLQHMSPRTVSQLGSRLAFLVSNHRELIRVLKKRS